MTFLQIRCIGSLLGAIGVAACALVGCDDRRPWLPHDPRSANTRFVYEYEVTGLRSLPSETLTMIVELSFDAMPVLHVDRVMFRRGGQTLAVADPYFIWLFPRLPAEGDESTPAPTDDAARTWDAIERADGAALRALFDRYEALKDDASLAEFDELPDTESTPLALRLLRSDRL